MGKSIPMLFHYSKIYLLSVLRNNVRMSEHFILESKRTKTNDKRWNTYTDRNKRMRNHVAHKFYCQINKGVLYNFDSDNIKKILYL